MQAIVKWSTFLFCLSVSLFAHATHIIAVTEHLPPYQQLKSNHDVSGFSVEIVKALGKQLGDDITFEVLPWKRAYRKAQEQKNVLIFSMYRIPARDELFKWVGKIDENVHYFYALRDKKKNHITDIDEAKKKIIAVTGNAFEDKQLTNKGFKRLARVSSPDQMVNLLFNGRVELLFGSEIAITNLASQAGRSPSELIRLITIENWGNGLWLAFSKQTPDATVLKYQRAFDQLQKSGQIESIKANHFHFDFIKP
ncbi:transporter substrate-binding domain-containing protein [Thalassotalea sp. 1_MG-2023]|uniref:substrate-binding periplasmic protein n=1 Tax=Thalassotalea sp. 1_MG-2023 TaxID=3062680 RepID=UPI0026E1A427|nr:transporter substrate-binding domain-containing protein [Thalassotalea sp. 1_MG-2023]MDO6427532.1 transporter substrate-binding domain-containing protein [Thalassotalea sp. 1_MG-2023]